MALLDKMERRFGGFAIPRVTWFIVVGQGLAYLLREIEPRFYLGLPLVPSLVLEGEVWRLLTFVLAPPNANLIFLVIGLYVFLMMGNALEEAWGSFRYNVYLLVGWAGTVVAAFAFPEVPASNIYFESTVFLAFATMFPNFEFLMFFILPVKVKWLALLTWLLYGYQMVTGSWPARYSIVVALGSFFLFFGRDILRSVREGKQRMDHKARFQSASFAPPPKDDGSVFHTCVTCGVTDVSDPAMDFRYCDECEGQAGYCEAHIRDHVHVSSTSASTESMVTESPTGDSPPTESTSDATPGSTPGSSTS